MLLAVNVIPSVALFPLLKGITTRDWKIYPTKRLYCCCTISVTEGNYDHTLTSIAYKPDLFYRCTISVTEGNYDRILTLLIRRHFSISCTISVTEGNYDIKGSLLSNSVVYAVALFPLLKGITTFKAVELTSYGKYHTLHYFRYWRELRQGCGVALKIQQPHKPVALFPLLKGITTPRIRWRLGDVQRQVALFPLLKGITTF